MGDTLEVSSRKIPRRKLFDYKCPLETASLVIRQARELLEVWGLISDGMYVLDELKGWLCVLPP